MTTQLPTPEAMYKEFAAKLAADREADAQRAQAATALAQAGDISRISSPNALYKIDAEQRQAAEEQQITDRANALIAQLGLSESDPELLAAYEKMQQAAEDGRADLYLAAIKEAANKKSLRLQGLEQPAGQLNSSELWKEVSRLARAGKL